ncbi:MAG: hypothetical protein KBS52_04830 [Clostridiales bacterium]|nr:hypothetical protein [Candidatus Equinaster intestinalis]
MFAGTFSITISSDGFLFANAAENQDFIKAILEFKGKTCTVLFDTDRLETVFSFDKEIFEGENYKELFSFKTGDTAEKIAGQFYIPKEYMKYYPDEEVFVIGLMESFSVASQKPQEAEDAAELEKILSEFQI